MSNLGPIPGTKEYKREMKRLKRKRTPSWNERQKASTHVTGKSRTWRVDPDENRKLQQKKKTSGVKSTYNTPSTKKTPKPATDNAAKIAKLRKRIKTGGMMMKRGGMKRRLELQIKKLGG